jgi:hypothetical protein
LNKWINILEISEGRREFEKATYETAHCVFGHILTALTVWTFSPNLEFYEKSSLKVLVQYLKSFRMLLLNTGVAYS